MSDYDPAERERSREVDDAPPAREAPNEDYKVFVGGISWQLDDGMLKDGENDGLPPCARGESCRPGHSHGA
jgi:hypothetical protein